jgi:predicted esterase
MLRSPRPLPTRPTPDRVTTARRRALAWLVGLAVVLPAAPSLGPGARAQPGSAPPGTPAPAPAAPAAAAAPPSTTRTAPRAWGVTRMDLANAYLALEQVLRQRPLEGEDIPAYNRRFDALTQLFFRADFAGAVQRVHALILDRLGIDDDEERFLRSIKVDVTPLIFVNGEDRQITWALSAMYPLPADRVRRVEFEAEIEHQHAIAGTRHTFVFDPGVEQQPFRQVKMTMHNHPVPRFEPGRHRVVIRRQGREPIVIGAWTVTDWVPSQRRRELEARLDAVSARSEPPADPALAFAVATARSRAALLVDRPSELSSAQSMTDPVALAAELEAEVAAIEAGRNPYAERAGEWWRSIDTESSPIPLRLYAPARAEGDHAPRPLLVALHGMGGDEQMFLMGYGAGRLRDLADRHGFIIAAPRTEALMGRGQNWDRLLSALMLDYRIDRDRIWVLGHSMGAGAAANLAMSRPDQIAGVACIAGGPRGTIRPGTAPILVIGAELDPIIPAAALEAPARRAADAGQPVEYRTAIGWGHTLVVGAYLDEAVQWLRQHSLATRADPRPAPAPQERP